MGASLDVCPDDENMCEEQAPEPCPRPGTVDGHEIQMLGNRKDFDEFFFSFDGATVHPDIAHVSEAHSMQVRGKGSSAGRGVIARKIMDSLMRNPAFPVEEESCQGDNGVVLPFGPILSFRSSSNRGSFASLSSFGSFASAISLGGSSASGATQKSQQAKQQDAKKRIIQLVSSLMKGKIVIMHSDDVGLTECTMQLDRALSVLEFRKQGMLLLLLPMASVNEVEKRSQRTAKLRYGPQSVTFTVELDDENECHVFVACMRVSAQHQRASMAQQQ